MKIMLAALLLIASHAFAGPCQTKLNLMSDGMNIMPDGLELDADKFLVREAYVQKISDIIDALTESGVEIVADTVDTTNMVRIAVKVVRENGKLKGIALNSSIQIELRDAGMASFTDAREKKLSSQSSQQKQFDSMLSLLDAEIESLTGIACK